MRLLRKEQIAIPRHRFLSPIKRQGSPLIRCRPAIRKLLGPWL